MQSNLASIRTGTWPTGAAAGRWGPYYLPTGDELTMCVRSRALALSPGLLAGNPPPRRGAPGDDTAAPSWRRQARIRHPGPRGPGVLTHDIIA
jgi:hypothetical protein